MTKGCIVSRNTGEKDYAIQIEDISKDCNELCEWFPVFIDNKNATLIFCESKSSERKLCAYAKLYNSMYIYTYLLLSVT